MAKKYKRNSKSNNSSLIITVVLLFILIIGSVIVGRMGTQSIYTIEVIGDNNVIVYKGSSYSDPGAKAYDSENNDFTEKIAVESNLNTNKLGSYQIKYSLGDIYVKRIIRVVDRPYSVKIPSASEEKEDDVLKNNGETTLKLKGKKTVYVEINGTYKDDGYSAYDTIDGNITSKVEVTHNIDNTKAGNYEIVYTVKNSAGVTTSVKRNVIVMYVDFDLKLNNSNYTNSDIGINITVDDDYFEKIELPNGQFVSNKNYIYTVSENGTYTFKLYNKHGIVKQKNITVSNIDRISPAASCSAEFKDNMTVVTVNSNDNVGVKNYVVNGMNYNTNKVVQASLNFVNNVIVYDAAGNSATARCDVTMALYVENIKSNGVIVTVNARNINTEIAGYYFSYNSTRPTKGTGGYVETSKDSIEVVRLPGTTYVWVEDKNGNISDPKKISLSNDVLLITTGSNYATLKNISLETYLSNKGWSKAELDKLIARSVRAAGVYSKEAAATAGVALQTVLAQKYKIKLPYWWGGKSWDYGTNKSWGTYRTKYSEEYDKWYYYYGFDCTGFVTWAYVNAGYDINSGQYPSYGGYKTYAIAKDNGDIGDFIVQPGHVKMIVGKTSTGFICAEASIGVSLSTHSYNKTSGYYIAKGENIAERYPKDSLANIPTGF